MGYPMQYEANFKRDFAGMQVQILFSVGLCRHATMTRSGRLPTFCTESVLIQTLLPPWVRCPYALAVVNPCALVNPCRIPS
eukprot:683062-Alexandrium_andersonii.AAC.1